MNQNLPGYLIVSLFESNACSVDEFLSSSDLTLSDELSFYSGNLKKLNGIYKDKLIRKKDLIGGFHPEWKTRFERLNSMSRFVYKYELSYSIGSLKSIIKNSQEDEPDRVLVFESSELPEDFLELLRVFHLNSFLYQRNASSGFIDHLYFKAGYISKNKLSRMLDGKGRGVQSETFQVIRPILDRDFKQNTDFIHRRAYLEG